MSIDVENKVIAQLQVKVELTTRDIDDLLSCAFEGGINYWCSRAYPYGYNDEIWPDVVNWTSQCLARGYDIALVDAEEIDENGNPVEYVLTLSAMIRGIEMFCDLHDRGYNIDKYDAGDADCIIQFALFGEVRFA